MTASAYTGWRQGRNTAASRRIVEGRSARGRFRPLAPCRNAGIPRPIRRTGEPGRAVTTDARPNFRRGQPSRLFSTERGRVEMRLPPGAVRALCKSAAGVALALFVASVAASAQDSSPAPAAFDPCPSNPVAPVSPHTLTVCFYRAAMRASRAARHIVEFETGTDTTSATAASFADAATATSEALVGIAGRPGGMSALDRITDVKVAVGVKPEASLADGVLKITTVPSRGKAGPPHPVKSRRRSKPPCRASRHRRSSKEPPPKRAPPWSKRNTTPLLREAWRTRRDFSPSGRMVRSCAARRR